MSELYCRNSWGLFWPTLFALKRFQGKSVYYLGYKDSEGRQHIIASDQIRAMTVEEAPPQPIAPPHTDTFLLQF